jgi:CRISPR-associated protein Cas1
MIRKVIEFATPGTRLTVANRQLVIERPDMERVSLPIEDLGVVIVDNVQTTYSHSVLAELMAAGATLIVSDLQHLPAGILLPLDAHTTQTERHRAQADAPEPVRKQAWQSLIRAKLIQQATVLTHFTGTDAGLGELAKRVRSGDPENLEAQAAQRYWTHLLGKSFRRHREGKPPNDLLNYGYAVLRAATARAIVAAGLIPTLGVHHRHRSNPFCLADDLIEPYRPYVDWRVKSLCEEPERPPRIDERPVRAALLSLFNETVTVGEKRSPLLLALHASAASLARALTGGERNLALPRGLPLPPEAENEADHER